MNELIIKIRELVLAYEKKEKVQIDTVNFSRTRGKLISEIGRTKIDLNIII